MNKKSTPLAVGFLCCFGLLYAQENTIKQDKSRINSNVVKVEDSTTDSLNNNLAMFFDNFSVGLNYGISEFNGDIREKGFMNSSNLSTAYNLRVGKEINNIFTCYAGFMCGALNGSREKESYDSEEPYDPYGKSDSLWVGEKFTADFIELDLITSINIKNVLQYYYKSDPDNPGFLNRIDFFYNLGLGVMSFNSIKKSIESDTYIYGYGYHDNRDGDFKAKKTLMERPLTRVLIYGYNISYSINKNIKCSLFVTSRLADSDFLDSSMMSQQNDKYRHIALGLDYIF